MEKLKQLNNEQCIVQDANKQNQTMSLYEELGVSREKKCIKNTDASLNGQANMRNNFTKEKIETCSRWRIPMKNKLLTLITMMLIMVILITVGNKVEAASVPLIMEWTVPTNVDNTLSSTGTPNTTIYLPIPANTSSSTVTNNYTVDWGDGSAVETFDGTTSFAPHVYSNTESTVYTIKIEGTVEEFGYTSPYSVSSSSNYYRFTQYLTKLVQWGELGITRYGFSYCKKLAGTLPAASENTFVNTTSMENLFYECTGITTLPNGLFPNVQNVTSFSKAFYNCTGLTCSIPSDLFSGVENAETFYQTFYACRNLSGTIPSGLFTKASKAENLAGVFTYCNLLTGPLPDSLFANLPNVMTYSGAFEGCTSINGEIPENLFGEAKKVTDIKALFFNCISLSGEIPGTLFSGMPELLNAQSVFYGCYNLEGTIPETLFADNSKIQYFDWTFYQCIGLAGPLPEKLFEKNIQVVSFNETFYGCTNLNGSIPAKLFSSNELASGFYSTFNSCTSLNGPIPGELFSKNIKANNFNATFANCTSLNGEIPEKLFFYNKNAISFNSVFQNCTSLRGEIPAKLFCNTPLVQDYAFAFNNCTGLTGHVAEELFEGNTGITWGKQPGNIMGYYRTFQNCTGITSASVNSLYIGTGMFSGCNLLIDITIGNNVQSMGADAFLATPGYSSTKLLRTNLYTENTTAINYNWTGDYRIFNVVLTEPEDLVVFENSKAQFSVGTLGNDIDYQWYEVSNGTENILEEEKSKLYKSSIEGESSTTATSQIIIKATEQGVLTFDYMVSSELDNDIFTITVEDANGTTIAVNGISGEIDWTEYSNSFVPNASGEIVINLTYSKNEDTDVGLDYGAIKGLKYTIGEKLLSTYENDNHFTIITEDESITSQSSHNWTTATEDDITIFKSTNAGESYSYATASIEINLTEEAILNFDYRVKSGGKSTGTFTVNVIDGNGTTTVASGIYGDGEWINFNNKVVPDEFGKARITLLYYKNSSNSYYGDCAAIRNLILDMSEEYDYNYEDDTTYTVVGSQWEGITLYTGANTSTLTIPEEQVTLAKNGTLYYCIVTAPTETVTTRQALLTVKEEIEYSKRFVMNWTIPAYADLDGSGTTITLPIPSINSNSYVVYWGDGTTSTYTKEEFPTHKYTNNEETTYEIQIAGKVEYFGYNDAEVPSDSNTQSMYYTFTQYLTQIIQWGELECTQYGFSNCINLIGTIPNPTGNSFAYITSLAYMFNNCSGLYSLELDVDTTNISNVDSMFAGCTSIKTIVLGSNFKKLDGTAMFNGCSNLDKIILLNNAKSAEDVAIIADASTIALPANTIIYIPTQESERVYESAWFGYIDETQVEPILVLVGKDIINLDVGESYTEEGYTVMGYDLTNATEYESEGYSVSISDSDAIDEVGSYVRRYTLYKTASNGIETEEVDSITRTINYGARSIHDAEVRLSQTMYTYNGEAKEPEVTVIFEGNPLSGDTDYDIQYANNTEVGIASVIITGKNEYVGQVVVNFIINSNETTDDEVVVDLTAPTISNILATVNEDIITITADIVDPNIVDSLPEPIVSGDVLGSGLNEAETRYAITTTNVQPSGDSAEWQVSNQFSTIDASKIYIWVKAVDNVGNTRIESISLRLEMAKLMEREPADMIDEVDVYYAIGAKRSGFTKYTADLIQTITLLDNNTVPEGVEASWDASFTSGDNEVMAWVTEGDEIDGTQMYNLYIGGDGEILAPVSSYLLFAYYRNCTTITGLEYLKTTNVENMGEMFSECNMLTDLKLSGFDTTNVTDMSYMFYYCTGLPELNVSTFKTTNVTDMSYMFGGLSVTELDLSNFNTINVTNMSGMFTDNANLTNINLSSFNTTNVETMRDMFWICPLIKEIDVSKFNTSNVYDMNSMFGGCSSLESLDIKHFDTTNVTDMAYMFYECDTLTNIDVSKLITTNVYDMTSMFYGCDGLTYLDLTKFDTANVSSMDEMFSNCMNLKSIALGKDFDKLIGASMFRYSNNLEAIITQRDATSANEAIMLGEEIWGTPEEGEWTETDVAKKLMLYVPDEDAEVAYESATNYETIFGAKDASGDIARVEQMLALVGEAIIEPAFGEKYVDEGVTVAGFDKDSEAEYTQYGYNVTIITSDNKDVYGSYDITYVLTLTVDEEITEIDKVARTIIYSQLMPAPIINAKYGNYNGVEYDGKLTNQSIAIELTSEYPEYVYKYEWSYTSGDGFTSANLITTSEGVGRIVVSNEMDGVIYFRAKDEASNYSEISSITIKIDKTAPSGDIEVVYEYKNDEEHKYVSNNTVTFKVTATDNVSENANIKIALINEDEFSLLNPNSEITWLDYEEEKTWTSSAGDGLKKVYVLFKDEAGNQSAYLAEE